MVTQTQRLQVCRPRPFTVATAAVRLSEHSSVPFDNENCLVVNTIFLANLSQAIVSF
jgi:hypothetical protein